MRHKAFNYATKCVGNGTFQTIAAITLLFGPMSHELHAQVDNSLDKKVSLHDTKADIKAFSKRMDLASSELERTEAVVDLATLYLTIVGDPRFARSEQLQGNRGRIAARLQKHNKLVSREIRRSDLARKKSKRIGKLRTDDGPSDLVSAKTEKQDNSFRSAVIDPHWKMISQIGGGAGPSMYYGSGIDGTAGHFWRSRGHLAGEPNDNGFELVDLIEAILHPDFWQSSGGPGMAYYYRPLRILVVRATTTVHEDLENFLQRLR